MPALKPLLVFGLRGTLLERIHIRHVPEGMPAPDLTVGTSKIWLRPHMMEVLRALQPHCRLAVWSSTTARNTHPLISAVFDSSLTTHADPPPPESAVGSGFAKAQVQPPAAAAAAEAEGAAASSSSLPGTDGEKGSGRGGRFNKKKRTTPQVVAEAATRADAVEPIRFEFVWTREHTRADDFRRLNASINDDNHATVKDLTQIFAQFPAIAQPENTVLIDDTPSKAKMHADNYVWLDTCEEFNITQIQGMLRLQDFVMKELLPAKDVRDVLCRRIRNH
jgi:hypothetical protein